MTTRSLSVIAAEIQRDWPTTGGIGTEMPAMPYLNAMRSMGSIQDKYGADSGTSVVLYFLSNASTWRGDTAKRIKAELKTMLKASGVRS